MSNQQPKTMDEAIAMAKKAEMDGNLAQSEAILKAARLRFDTPDEIEDEEGEQRPDPSDSQGSGGGSKTSPGPAGGDVSFKPAVEVTLVSAEQSEGVIDGDVLGGPVETLGGPLPEQHDEVIASPEEEIPAGRGFDNEDSDEENEAAEAAAEE